MLTTTSTMLHRTASNSELVMKSSCSDLQSRLKVRKVLGVGDTAGSKISQILGHSDHLIFQSSPKLTAWLLLTTTLFSCFTIMGLLWPSCLRLILPGDFESTVHLATSYAFLVTIIALTLRSGDKIALKLVLFSLALFHALSLFISIWFLKTNNAKIKSIISIILHLFCLLMNTYFYQSLSSSRSHNKLKAYFYSLLSYSSTVDHYGHDS